MKKPLQTLGYIVVTAILLFLLVGLFAYRNASQRSGLASLCATARAGEPITTLLNSAAKTKFKLRTGGPIRKDENDWFDREYLRIGEWLKETKNISDDYTIVFAKPGIGYYACVVLHPDALVTRAWFENRSD